MIIEDEEIVREGLSLLVGHQPGFRVVGLASTIKDALAIAERERPDVALLDIKLGNEDGIDCLPLMQTVSPKTRVLILTGLSDIETHYAAVSHGAMGIVRKIEGPETLVNAIRKVLAGEVWLNSELMTRVVNDFRQARANASSETPGEEGAGTSAAPAPGWRLPVSRRDEYEEVKIARLTDREREVIELVGKGMRNQQIADKLCISVITVRHHLTSIFSKLEVGDRFELAIYSFRHGLAKPPI
ncbi:MAG TPA: response regulator transcription factor [Blastocatellia bacterium]|nr:response regulator transcription factor [Blastocatellia bacterium]